MSNDLTDRLQAAISAAFSEAELGGLVTRWVLMAETISADGEPNERFLHTVANEDAPWWDIAGLLRAGADGVIATHITDEVSGDDED